MFKKLTAALMLSIVVLLSVGVSTALAANCYKCEGSGKVRDPKLWKWRKINCERCKGSGQITTVEASKEPTTKANEAVCYRCNGRGKTREFFRLYKCTECGGDGIVNNGRP